MYLIYFYSHISDKIIAKDYIDDFSNIRENIIKVIKDIIIFEEGRKKADLLYIFKEDEKILLDSLDDGLYIREIGEKFIFNKKITKAIIDNGWFGNYNRINSENILVGYVSYLEIPNNNKRVLTIDNQIVNNINSNIIVNDKINNMEKHGFGFEGVLDELKKRQMKMKNA
jgi:hypothetical protein